MNASQKLDHYLDSFRARLRKLTLLQGAAVVTFTLLVLSTIGAWFSADAGFAANTTNVFRIILILGIAAVAVRFLVDPLQKLKQGVSGQVEARVPEFNGRVATYAQEKSSNNPFVDLLAEDALKISSVYPVEEQVAPRELQLAGGALAAAAILFLYLLIAGPNFLNYGMRNLLAGWAFSDLLPPQTITVTPGDESVRRGANVRVTAVMAGFEPDEATIHITMMDGNAQDVAMVQSPLGFEFTFFSMQQDMSYYVSSSGGLRSPEYDISVLDVPGIESLSLTYNYPEWTERDPETFTQGDVRALVDTRVALTVTTTAPLPAGELVLNSTGQPLAIAGNNGSSEFTVTQEGEYYLAAIVGGEHVRISDDYFIRLTEDGKPVIEIVKPGGDYNASNIEEVKLNVTATDDYGINALALKYSVNGGEFQTIDLTEANSREINAEYLMMLENMKSRATQAVTANVGQFNIQLTDEEPAAGAAAPSDPVVGPGATASGGSGEEQAAGAGDEIPLQPGDLITYYAEGSDRSSTVRTDMFFINVQPYNRRYSQSQLSGGGGGGGGGGQQQDEISQRQRQIIVSTWNLIRDKQEDDTNEQVDINSKLLSDLQLTLAEQAATLAERTRARQLDGDPQIEEFVNNMEQAVQRMHPASEELAAVNLDEAIQPAQEALQYLLRAESVFNDITITQQQGGGGGGGGGRAQQDLAEMFELEMDLELNQYETGNQASQQSQQEEAEDIMKQLDELAKRQEQLANNLRNQQQLTDAQRWQQEMLRREAEELQEQLNQLQRQQQNGQQQSGQQQANSGQQQGQQQGGQQGQQGQPGQPGQGGQQGQQGGEQQNGESGEQVAQSELQRRMESAIRAMNQASEGLQGNASPEELQRAADEASRQLQEAREQVAAEQLAGMQQTFENMAQLGEQMTQEQQRIEQALQEAALRATKDRDSGKDPNSTGLTMAEGNALAEQGRELAQKLQQLQQQMSAAQQNFSEQVPDAAANELERAANDITERQLEAAVSETATYVEVGYNLYITSQQSAVTSAMRELEERLARANELVEQASAPGDSDLDRARRQAEDLRAQLQQLAQNGQPGQGGQQQDPNGSPSDQPGQQQNQQGGQQGQQGQQGQGGQQQGGQRGGFGDRFGFGPRNLGGAWDGRDDFFDGPITLPDTFYDNVGDLTQIARSAIPDMNLSPEEMEELYNLIRQLEGQQVNRNESILAQEYGEMLALVEQLEAGLKLDEDNRGGNVRTATSDEVPEEYQESVAEYFRRLSREE
jgi:uncharacterized protein (DUF1499 family)